MLVIKLADTFTAGEASFADALRKHWAEPTGFVPQHDQAHVRIGRQQFKTGRDVIEARKRRQ